MRDYRHREHPGMIILHSRFLKKHFQAVTQPAGFVKSALAWRHIIPDPIHLHQHRIRIMQVFPNAIPMQTVRR